MSHVCTVEPNKCVSLTPCLCTHGHINPCMPCVQVFGRVVDPENFADQAYLTMNAWQVELADSRIGCLRMFSPDNPTGAVLQLLP